MATARNDTCPCGSGLKYKRCCLAKDEQRHREQDEAVAKADTWYPTADDLRLPDVPESLRSEVRLLVSRALPLPVRLHECWKVAQTLTLVTAGSLGYVEGVWECDCDENRCHPHGWNIFKGHVVDLLAEFRMSLGEGVWKHEPLKEYTFTEVQAFTNKYRFRNCTIARCQWLDNGGRKSLPKPDNSYADNEHWDYVDRIVFRDARERLMARINATRA
jgi:hypothetical protein